jgi:hypothetical protein
LPELLAVRGHRFGSVDLRRDPGALASIKSRHVIWSRDVLYAIVRDSTDGRPSARCACHGPRDEIYDPSGSRRIWETRAPERQPSAIRPWIETLLIRIGRGRGGARRATLNRSRPLSERPAYRMSSPWHTLAVLCYAALVPRMLNLLEGSYSEVWKALKEVSAGEIRGIVRTVVAHALVNASLGANLSQRILDQLDGKLSADEETWGGLRDLQRQWYEEGKEIDPDPGSWVAGLPSLTAHAEWAHRRIRALDAVFASVLAVDAESASVVIYQALESGCRTRDILSLINR